MTTEEDIKCYLFVGNIPLDTTKRDLDATFSRFGKVRKISVFDKDKELRKCPMFAFVGFDRHSSVQAALRENGKIKIGRNKLNLQERLPKHDHETILRNVLDAFDWHLPAAKYNYREEKMEHFLSEYVHALGCYQGLKQESMDSLITKLVRLSESIPDDKYEIMPPHLSGMVSNLTNYNKRPIMETKLKGFLASSPHLIRIDEESRKVFYLGNLSQADTRESLTKILIEGLFIYFFAKFSHGKFFKITPQYYMKSEPIRTVLMLVTGKKTVTSALSAYFSKMKPIFVYSKGHLSLKHDLRSKELSAELEPFRMLSSKPSAVIDQAGQVLKLDEHVAEISFEMGIALLKPCDFKSRGIREGSTIRFNATKNAEGKWICSLAWLPNAKLYELKGTLASLDSESLDGTILFQAPNQSMERACFRRDALYNLGDIEQGTEVSFDAQPSNDNTTYEATLVWKGVRPHKKELDIKLIQVQVDNFLNGGSGNDLNNNGSGEMFDDAEMPECVQSVVSDVLKEDQRPKCLINKNVLYDLIYEFDLGDEEASKIVTKAESKLRLCLIEIFSEIVLK